MTRTRAVLGSISVASGLAQVLVSACVPPGNSTPTDSGAPPPIRASSRPTHLPQPPESAGDPMLTEVFEDNFDRPTLPEAGLIPLATEADADASDASPDGAGAALATLADESGLGPNWRQAQTTAWRVENGQLCGQNARNHGVWLRRRLPENARIEFTATTHSADGDLKAEVWGDGQSSATSMSYTNATSYLTIFGGWKNSLHVLARIDEHGSDRKASAVVQGADDVARAKVQPGRAYRFKIERTDGKTLRWYVDGELVHTFEDPAPLAGVGHDHFGFNDWQARVCFDNVKVTPLGADTKAGGDT